jgi:O-antigen/teichoic acid export membrane protein
MLAGLLTRLGVRQSAHVSVARDFTYSGLNSVSLVLLLSTAIVLRRYLGPYLTGIWTALELLPTYVGTYGHFGALTAAERDLPFLLGARREREFDALRQTLFWFVHGVGAALALALAATALAVRSRVEAQTFTGMLLYAPILWAQLAATYYVVLYRARRRFGELSVRQGGSNLLKAVLLVAGAYGFGLPGVLVVELGAALLLAGVLHAGLREPFARVFDRSLLPPLIAAGVPMVAGAVAFETLRGADQMMILAVLGPTPLGVYSLTSIVCSGLFYIPNVLSTVMYPRFQERFATTDSARSLRRFVEVQLLVLADVLLAAIVVLGVALPPAIAAFFPKFVETVPPLRVMLVGTYFLCLTPPAAQFLLTVHKQVRALYVSVPAMLLALGAAYVGTRYGLAGVAAGVSIACVAEFIAINAYAFSHFADAGAIAGRLATIAITAAVVVALAQAIEAIVPPGPAAFAVIGGWRLVAIGALICPLLLRAARRVR